MSVSFACFGFVVGVIVVWLGAFTCLLGWLLRGFLAVAFGVC